MLCRRCGATIHDGLRVCPHCGERQARQPSHVSCAHCHHKASAASSICPRCGQTLRARRLSGGVLTSVGLILIASLALSAGVASRSWGAIQESAQERLARIEAGVNELGGKVLDTASSLAVAEVESATPTPTPVVVLAVLPDAARVLTAPLQSDVVLAPTTVGAVGGTGMEPAAVVAAVGDEASPTVQPTEPPTPAPATATAAPTATEPPTAVPPTATPTATDVPPTATPTLPATPTTAPATPTPQAVAAAATGGGGLTHAVQAGDNWFSIAQRYGITQEALATFNNSRSSDVLQVGQVLRIPTSSAAAAGGASGQTHRVQAGENWFTIARRYGLTQEALAAYNNSRPSDVLQVGQVLRVPAAGTAISPPPATPTPVRPTAAPATVAPTAPAATPAPRIPPVVALAAPSLLSPMNGDGFTAGTQPVLRWRPVSGFGPQDFYYVLVRYTMRDGQQGYVDDRVTSTSFTVPNWVYDLAASPDRLSTWSVQVRRLGPGNQEIEISPPSESRTYYWR